MRGDLGLPARAAGARRNRWRSRDLREGRGYRPTSCAPERLDGVCRPVTEAPEPGVILSEALRWTLKPPPQEIRKLRFRRGRNGRRRIRRELVRSAQIPIEARPRDAGLTEEKDPPSLKGLFPTDGTDRSPSSGTASEPAHLSRTASLSAYAATGCQQARQKDMVLRAPRSRILIAVPAPEIGER